MKALCTEAALLALRRRYPQIYTSTEKLQLDVTSILMCAKDFHKAMQIIVPSSQRAVTSPARALAVSIRLLLRKQFSSILDSLQAIFPSVLAQLSNLDAPGKTVISYEINEFCKSFVQGSINGVLVEQLN